MMETNKAKRDFQVHMKILPNALNMILFAGQISI